MKHILYLASNSLSRKLLLEQAKIPFCIIEQFADESQIDRAQSFEQIVREIAKLKMNCLKLPNGAAEDELAFVLTADTMGLSANNRLLGKPKDRADAISMLKACQEGAQITKTGFCLRKYQWQHGHWQILDEVVDCDSSKLFFNVPDEMMDFYLENIPYLSVSGAVSIEGIGGQFCQYIEGSYESIIGLPMYKIRKALLALKF